MQDGNDRARAELCINQDKLSVWMCLVGMWLADDLVQGQLTEHLPHIEVKEREKLIYRALVFSIAHKKVHALRALFEFRADLRDLDVGWKATFVEFSEVRAPHFVLCLH